MKQSPDTAGFVIVCGVSPEHTSQLKVLVKDKDIHREMANRSLSVFRGTHELLSVGYGEVRKLSQRVLSVISGSTVSGIR